MPELTSELDARTTAAPEPLQPTPRQLLTLFGAYFALQAVLRVFVSDTVELDEAEQVLFAQSWRWGYGSSPPLYTWLQILSFQVFGTNVLALALLKNAILFLTFVVSYLGGRAVFKSEALAMVAAGSLLLFPQVTWESQRDLTHSVLATFLAAAPLHSAANLRLGPRWRWFALLGLWTGLGALTKSSYLLFAVALLVSALTMAQYRRLLMSRGLALTAIVFLVLTAPYFHWVWASPDLALRRSQEIIQSNQGAWLATRGEALLSVGQSAVVLGGVITVVYWIAFGRTAGSSRGGGQDEAQKVFGRTLCVVGLTSFLIALGFGIRLKDRWFQPVVPVVTFWAAGLVRARLRPVSASRFYWFIAGIALVTLLILPGIPMAASVTRRPTRLNAPYSALGEQLRARVGSPEVIVAGTRWIGGNLRFRFPSAVVLVPEYQSLAVRTNTDWLIVWDASKSDLPGAALEQVVASRRGLDLHGFPPEYIEANYKYASTRRMRLGYVRLPAVFVER